MEQHTPIPGDDTAGGPGPAAIFKMVVAAVVLAAAVAFAVQNAQSVEVEFLSWSFSIRLIILLVISAAVGVGLQSLVAVLWRRRKNRSG
ncbi:MAG: LapA family protein [Acidimicrobiales bacterium]|nr:LapA family protein [Acidimicrobiales bacterium]